MPVEGGGEEDGDDFGVWVGTAEDFLRDAEQRLASCVMLVLGLVSHPYDALTMSKPWVPVSFWLDGHVYVVEPADVSTPDDPGSLDWTPRLIVCGPGCHDDSGYGNTTW